MFVLMEVLKRARKCLQTCSLRLWSGRPFVRFLSARAGGPKEGERELHHHGPHQAGVRMRPMGCPGRWEDARIPDASNAS